MKASRRRAIAPAVRACRVARASAMGGVARCRGELGKLCFTFLSALRSWRTSLSGRLLAELGKN